MHDFILKIQKNLRQPDQYFCKKHWQGYAAVLVLFVEDNDEWLLLLTKRALTLHHHGGEIAFPGGKWDAGETFPVMTALREAEEEVGILPESVNVIGVLPQLSTRYDVKVVPVVGTVATKPVLYPSAAEIDSVFWMPLSELLEDQRIRTDIFTRGQEDVWSPAYRYQSHEIWGFTAGVIKMLLNQCLGANLKREHTAPEKFWS